MTIKNKKADITLEGVLKILLAVLCLVILIFLAVKLYNMFTIGAKIEQAEATLNEIVGKIKSLQNEELTKSLLMSPEDWYLVFYSEEDTKRPNGCGEEAKSCLCLCPEGTDFGDRKIIEKCEKSGRCNKLETEKKIQFIVYEIQPSYLKTYSGYGGGYGAYNRPSVTKKNWIKLDTAKSIEIENKKDNENNEVIIIREIFNTINSILNTNTGGGPSGDWTFEKIIEISFKKCNLFGVEYNKFNMLEENVRSLEKLSQEDSQQYNGLIQIFRTRQDGTGIALTSRGSSQEIISSVRNPTVDSYDDSRKQYKKICDEDFKVFIVYVPEKE